TFYQDVFYGGVTGGGFSTGLGVGTGSFNLYIEPGSTIKKAFLFSYSYGYPQSVPLELNGVNYYFQEEEVVSSVNNMVNQFISPIKLYSKDLTDELSSNFTTTFNVSIPQQDGMPYDGF